MRVFGPDLAKALKNRKGRRTGRATFDLTTAQSKIYRLGQAHRFLSIVAGRRFGKTTVSEAKLVSEAMRKRDGLFYYVAPTRLQAEDIAWKPLKAAVAGLNAKINESKLSIALPNGAVIKLQGAEHPDRLRGPGLDGIVFDEVASFRLWDEVWEVVRPMLSDKLGWGWLIGTPKGRNHFYELHQEAKGDTSGEWKAIEFRSVDGGWITPEEIQKAAAEMDEKSFRQEYYATFESWSGLVYYCFSRERNVKEVEYSPLYPIRWCLDFNVDPCVNTIAQVEEKRRAAWEEPVRTIRVIDELNVTDGGGTRSACEAFARWAMKWHVGRTLDVQVYGDPAGHGRSTLDGTTDWQLVRQFFGNKPQFRLTFNTERAAPLVKHRVNVTNSLLHSFDGAIRMTVHPRCKMLIEDYEKVSWETARNGRTTGDIDKSDKNLTHASDSLGYMLETEFGALPTWETGSEAM